MTAGYWLMKNEAGSAQYPMLQFDIDQQTTRAIDTARLIVPKSFDSNLSFGDDLSIINMQNNAGTAYIIKFGGYLTDKNIGDDMDLTIESYGSILNRTNIEEVYYNQGPEGILQQMVDGFTDLNFASTGSSGLTISKFKVNNQTISWAVKEFSNLIDWVIKTDVNKNLYYAPEGQTESSETLNVNDNCYMKSDWEKVPDRIINEVIFVGGVQKFNTSESFVATAAQTDFITIYSPSGNVRVTDDGTEVVGGVSGSTGTYDYTWDADTKTITFEVGRTVGHTIVITYMYEMPIKITSRNDASITSYGLYSKKITNNKINSMGDARSYVQTILDKYSEPGVRGTVVGPTSLNVAVGELIQVNDALNSINEQMVIQRLKEKYPDGVYEILVGSQEWKMMDWQKETEDRLKKLEDEQDNSTLVQVYRSVIEPMIVTFNSQSYAFMRSIYNAPQWNVAVWNVDRWDDTREGDTFKGYGTAVYDVAHYRLNDNSSDTLVQDSSRTGITGTASKNTNLFTTTGKINQAFDFDGLTDYINCGNNSALNMIDVISISMWVWADTLFVYDSPLMKSTATSWNNGYGFWVVNATTLGFFVNNYLTSATGGLTTGAWHHVVGTYDGINERIYIDNIEGTPQAKTGAITISGNNFEIGRGVTNQFNWDGKIDDVRVYHKVLNATEIALLYNGGVGTENELVGLSGAMFSNVWDATGSAKIVSNQLKMSAGVGSAQHAIFKGWVQYYSDHNGRVVIDMDKSASVGTLDFDFRMSGTGNNCYSARFDFVSDKVAVVTKNAGTVSGIIGSASNTFSATNNVMYLLYQDDKIWLYKDGTFLLDLTDSTYTNTGTVGFRWQTPAGTASVSLNSFKIYKGD